jgi:hypothetical protein
MPIAAPFVLMSARTIRLGAGRSYAFTMGLF